MTMNPVVHFELPAEDRSRMRAFYENTFGWKTEQLGPEMGDYVLAITTETDASGRPKTPGMINGGCRPGHT
jgi:predicted enzyme related to lactoylglutathione lyase